MWCVCVGRCVCGCVYEHIYVCVCVTRVVLFFNEHQQAKFLIITVSLFLLVWMFLRNCVDVICFKCMYLRVHLLSRFLYFTVMFMTFNTLFASFLMMMVIVLMTTI